MRKVSRFLFDAASCGVSSRFDITKKVTLHLFDQGLPAFQVKVETTPAQGGMAAVVHRMPRHLEGIDISLSLITNQASLR
ncbi:MAG: hypothetical protein OSB05_12860 [Akkermansiaceae bacterium]|nr:hypothetical protein [Akkermansiaceae bacterium]